MQILGLLGMYVLVTNSSLLFRLALAILWYIFGVLTFATLIWRLKKTVYIQILYNARPMGFIFWASMSLQHPIWYFISLWISLTLKKVIPKLNSNICNNWKLEQYFFYAWHFRSWVLTFRRCLYRIWLHVKILATLQFLLKIRTTRWKRFYAKFATIDSGQTKKAQHSFELEKQIWKELIAVYTALCVDDSYKTMVSVTPT